MKIARLIPLCLTILLHSLITFHSLQAAESPVEQFFRQVETGDVATVMKAMHPQLAQQIDPPVLEAWLQAVSFRLGSLVEILPQNDLIKQDLQEYTARIQFEKGKAEATLRLKGKAIIAFEVKSAKLINWFQRPTSLQFYQKQGEKFLQKLQAQQFDQCKNLLHQKIASQLSENELENDAEKIVKKVGTIESTLFQYSQLTILPDERLQQIDLFYKIKGDRGIVQAELAIRFQGMKGYIVGFEFYDAVVK